MHDRRARTRRLIELGGLVAKSRADELIALREQDVHAVLLGDPLDVLGEAGRPTLGPQQGPGLTGEVGQAGVAAGEEHRHVTGVGVGQVDDVGVAGRPDESVGAAELHQLAAQALGGRLARLQAAAR